MADLNALSSRSRAGFARATALLSFGLVANLATQMTFAATLHEIAVDWALDASESGWIGGIYFAGYAVAVPFLASATDRMDGRWLYVGSALLGAAVSFAFAAFAHGFLVGLVIRFLGGIGLAGIHMPGLNLLISDQLVVSGKGGGDVHVDLCSGKRGVVYDRRTG
jgi:MFS family permease